MLAGQECRIEGDTSQIIYLNGHSVPNTNLLLLLLIRSNGHCEHQSRIDADRKINFPFHIHVIAS